MVDILNKGRLDYWSQVGQTSPGQRSVQSVSVSVTAGLRLVTAGWGRGRAVVTAVTLLHQYSK